MDLIIAIAKWASYLSYHNRTNYCPTKMDIILVIPKWIELVSYNIILIIYLPKTYCSLAYQTTLNQCHIKWVQSFISIHQNTYLIIAIHKQT